MNDPLDLEDYRINLAIANVEVVYNGYGEQAKWRTYDDKPMPKWNELREDVRDRWIAGTLALIEALNIRPASE